MIHVKEMGADKMNDINEVSNHFYDKYNSQIRAIVSRILTNANQTRDIDDCVNTVYLELMEKLQQYSETRGSMAAFVAIIARSAAIDYCRSNMRKPGELIGDDMIDFLAEPIEFESQIEFQMLVESILAKLNKSQRILFTMRYILFYSPEEIAKALKIRRGAVYMRLSTLKRKVRDLLIKGGIKI